MLANKKSNLLRLFSIFFLLFSCQKSFGQQGEIIEILSGGNKVDKIKIIMAPPLGKPEEITVQKRTSKPGSKVANGAIIDVPSKIKITIESSNTNVLIIEGPKVIEYKVSANSENYRTLDNNDQGFLNVKVLKKLLGSVTSENATGEIDGSARFTEWNFANDSTDVKFELKKGEVAINSLTRIEIEDENIKIDDSLKRVLFINETVQFINLKNPNFQYGPDKFQVKSYASEEDINKFFSVEFKKQKKLLKSGGQNSKLGFRSLEQGLYEEGISHYEMAMEQGEIDIDRFIQGSLILIEAYLINNNIKDRDVWLDAALHFIKKADEINRIKFKNFNDIGEKKIAKAFGSDWVLSKEYYAWAYTVKLKLTRCLETADQNPLKYIKEASQLKNLIKNY